MADKVSPTKRSSIMRSVKSKDTTPELITRRLLHRLGYRYQIHTKDLPGHPDLVFPARKKVIFVHGCYWHRHLNCSRASTPASNTEYWSQKFRQNQERDQKNYRLLQADGWRILVVWECETKDLDALQNKLTTFLGPPKIAN